MLLGMSYSTAWRGPSGQAHIGMTCPNQHSTTGTCPEAQHAAAASTYTHMVWPAMSSTAPRICADAAGQVPKLSMRLRHALTPTWHDSSCHAQHHWPARMLLGTS